MLLFFVFRSLWGERFLLFHVSLLFFVFRSVWGGIFLFHVSFLFFVFRCSCGLLLLLLLLHVSADQGGEPRLVRVLQIVHAGAIRVGRTGVACDGGPQREFAVLRQSLQVVALRQLLVYSCVCLQQE